MKKILVDNISEFLLERYISAEDYKALVINEDHEAMLLINTTMYLIGWQYNDEVRMNELFLGSIDDNINHFVKIDDNCIEEIYTWINDFYQELAESGQLRTDVLGR